MRHAWCRVADDRQPATSAGSIVIDLRLPGDSFRNLPGGVRVAVSTGTQPANRATLAQGIPYLSATFFGYHCRPIGYLEDPESTDYVTRRPRSRAIGISTCVATPQRQGLHVVVPVDGDHVLRGTERNVHCATFRCPDLADPA